MSADRSALARAQIFKSKRPDIDALRAALEQRAARWKLTLRGEPAVARVLLRRLMGPLTMWDPTDPGEAWTEWEASLTPALLEGLAAMTTAVQVVASLVPASWNQIVPWLRQIDGLRQAA